MSVCEGGRERGCVYIEGVSTLQGIVLDVSPIKCSKLDTSACNQ